jgi:hypothetical protein
MRAPLRMLVIASVMTLSSGGFAFAHTSVATAPARGSTGPTVADTRPVDQRQVNTSASIPTNIPPSPDGSRSNAERGIAPTDKP